MDQDSIPPSLHSKPWQCWGEGQRKDWRTNSKAIDLGFDGACTFSDYENPITPDEVLSCMGDTLPYLPYHPRDCGPGPQTYWGACMTNISERWECIPKSDPSTVARMAKGDCKTQSVREDPGGNLYTNVCRFLPTVISPYKCDDVQTYDTSDGATCGSNLATYNHACFSEAKGDSWQCFDETIPVGNHTPCTWSMSGRGEFYDGLCLFPSNPGYAMAGEDPTAAPHPETTLPPPPTPAPAPAPTPAPTAAPTTTATPAAAAGGGMGAGAIVGIIIVIVIILGIVGFLVMKSQGGGGGARAPLVGGAVQSEMAGTSGRGGQRL